MSKHLFVDEETHKKAKIGAAMEGKQLKVFMAGLIDQYFEEYDKLKVE